MLLSGLGKAISIQQAPVAGYVRRLRRARPEATPAEIVAVLEKRYVAVVTGTGAAVGSTAAVQTLGTVVALALCGGADTAVFLQATAWFALAAAEVHGIRVQEVERRRTLVLAVVAGEHGAMLVEKMVGQAGEHWARLLPEVIPISSITALNKTLGRCLVTHYGDTRLVVAMGRVAPCGIGAAVGAGGNRAMGRMVVTTSRRVFGPPPVSFPHGGMV